MRQNFSFIGLLTICFLLSLILLPFAFSIPTSNLVAHYSFDSTNISQYSNSVSGSFLSVTGSGAVSDTTHCISGNCVYNAGNITTFNDTFSKNFFNSPFTINVWVYINGTTGSQKIFTLANSTTATAFDSSLRPYSTNIIRFRNDYEIYTSGTSIYNNYLTMFTLVYDGSLKIYANGAFVAESNSSPSFPKNVTYLKINNPGYYSWVDELSVFNTSLNEYDIIALYNGGVGLNYSGIVNSTIVYSNTSREYYNLCIPFNSSTILCSVLTETNSGYSCNDTTLEYCDYDCQDTFNYWNELNQLPPYNDYEGACVLCSSTCSVPDLISCFANSTKLRVQCQEVATGCYQNLGVTACGNNEYCSLGSCLLIPGQEDPLGTTTTSSIDMWDGTLGISSDTASNRLLIAVLTLLLGGVLFSILFASLSYASGYDMPLILTGILVFGLEFLGFIYFVSIGFIPLWVLILLVILVAFGVASFVVGKIFKGR